MRVPFPSSSDVGHHVLGVGICAIRTDARLDRSSGSLASPLQPFGNTRLASKSNETDSCAVVLSLPLGPIGRCNPRDPDSRNLSAAPCHRICGDSHVNVGMSPRRFVWPVLLTLIGGWVVHTSPRTPFGFLQALVWLAVVIFVWAYALWRRRG